MSEVAALIADMVRAGVDADLIGRTAQALAEREPVFVQAGDAAGVSAEGHDGRSPAAIRQARYRARRAAGRDAGHNAGVTRYASRYGAAETDDGATGPGIVGDRGEKATDGATFDRNAALRCVTGDVTRYGDGQKENTPHTPQVDYPRLYSSVSSPHPPMPGRVYTPRVYTPRVYLGETPLASSENMNELTNEWTEEWTEEWIKRTSPDRRWRRRWS